MRVSLILPALVFVCCASAQSQPPAPGAGAESQQSQSATSQIQSAGSSKNSPVPPAIAQTNGENKESSSEEKQANPPKKWWFQDPAWLTVIVTFGILIATAAQACIYKKQTRLMRISLKVTQRAASASNASARAAEDALNFDLKLRQNRSIYAIAEKFEGEAYRWAEKAFTAGNAFVIWHNESIDRLSPFVHYLETYHGEIFTRICPPWVAFHGGNAKAAIKIETYLLIPDHQHKDFWVNQLFQIADLIRETQTAIKFSK